MKANFAEIEQRVNESAQSLNKSNADSLKLTESHESNPPDGELDVVANIRLAYEELSIRKGREEAKMQSIDPTKAKQMDRLGMGFNYKK